MLVKDTINKTHMSNCKMYNVILFVNRNKKNLHEISAREQNAMMYSNVSMNIVRRRHGYTTIMKLVLSFVIKKKDFCKSLFSSLLYG